MSRGRCKNCEEWFDECTCKLTDPLQERIEELEVEVTRLQGSLAGAEVFIRGLAMLGYNGGPPDCTGAEMINRIAKWSREEFIKLFGKDP